MKNSALIAIAGTQTAKNWSGMSRQQGDPVPFSKEEYSAMMKGMFSLDLEQSGTFSLHERTGFKNLNQALVELALANGAEAINDPFAKNKKGEPLQLYRLPRETRVQRIQDAIAALRLLSGGAMQTDNMADVTPKFIVLATFKSGNHPFSHIATEAANTEGFGTHANISISGLKEVLKEYEEQFEGTIFIGKRTGFLDEATELLRALETEFSNVKFGSINESIENYVHQLEQHIP